MGVRLDGLLVIVWTCRRVAEVPTAKLNDINNWNLTCWYDECIEVISERKNG